MYQVVKRDGSVVDFNISKISAAITKAFEALGKQYHPNVIDLIAIRVTSDYEEKIRNRQAYVFMEDGKVRGILRYNLFWDNTPFCTLLTVDGDFRGRGAGRELMETWEQDMREQGYGLVMTSTQVDEQAQHFYRKLGYRDCGGFVVNVPGYEQPMEMIMIKAL